MAENYSGNTIGQWWGKFEEDFNVEPQNPYKPFSSIEVYYGTSASNTDPSTVQSWQSTIPQVGENDYLWTKISVIYVDGSITNAYAVSKPSGGGGGTVTVISKTYSELAQIIANSGLSMGTYYRITDYVCTTSLNNTSADTHQFDILVLAVGNHTLSNSALAVNHVGDTYFTNSRLDNWSLKYSFANDTNLFEWADTSNGKGVIYYMKDEYGNEAPYDFKNIKFVKNGFTGYTFSNSNGNTDLSLNGNHHNNTIGEWLDNGRHKLNFNLFIGDGCYYNVLPDGCNNNTFGAHCESNKLGLMCSNNTFGSYCHHNTFGNNCYRFTVGQDFRYANVGNDSHDITFVDSNNNLLTYVYNVEIGEAVHWIKFVGNNTNPSSYNKLQNLNIAMGIEGTNEYNPMTITLTVPRNSKYTWNVAYDSDNNIKQWCDADKQDKLISGTNIKTINDISILGSGNISADTTPTSGSTNLITSGAVYDAIIGAINANY